MAKNKIIIQLQAYSEAAGKYDPNAPLLGNEDNWFVDDDLSDDIPGRFNAGADVALSDVGCLMVVADGMGGMNAGEVASQIAIDTVNEYFAPGKITPEMAANPKTRREILERLIKDADHRIKTDARVNPEHAGMGSTIILAWIVGDKMTLSWCGDSRAYRWNPKFGIEPLSTDHSYVQQLVMQGVITYADTFDHPQGNLVTRSLGDPNNSAKPETREFDVYQNDVILLCSDGLSGVLRDKKTPNPNGGFYPGENIEELIAANADSMVKCSSELMRAAEQADWYDNVTVLLCKIKEGGKKVPDKVTVRDNEGPGLIKANDVKDIKRQKLYMLVGASVLLIGIICSLLYFFVLRDTADKPINPSTTGVETQDGTFVDGTDVSQPEATNTPQLDRKPGDNKPKGKNEKTGDKEKLQDTKSQEKELAEKLVDGNGVIVSLCEQDEGSEPEELTLSNQKEELVPKKQETDRNWRDELIKEVNNLKVPSELNKCKNEVINRIKSEEVTETDCKEYIANLKARIAMYNKVKDLNYDNLSDKDKQTYNGFLSTIVNPEAKYVKDSWNRRYKELKEKSERVLK